MKRSKYTLIPHYLTRALPPTVKAQAATGLVCPLRNCSSFPVSTSHKPMVSSQEQEASSVPLGEKQT